MDRHLGDEKFVSRALEEAEFKMGRWIANQAFFNHLDDDELRPIAQAGVVTATSIY